MNKQKRSHSIVGAQIGSLLPLEPLIADVDNGMKRSKRKSPKTKISFNTSVQMVSYQKYNPKLDSPVHSSRHSSADEKDKDQTPCSNKNSNDRRKELKLAKKRFPTRGLDTSKSSMSVTPNGRSHPSETNVVQDFTAALNRQDDKTTSPLSCHS